MTVGGIAWMLAARPWGIASDRHGRRRILLGGLAGFALSYGSLCLFIVLALHWTLPTLLAFAGIVLLRGLAGGFYAAVPACTAALVADHVEGSPAVRWRPVRGGFLARNLSIRRGSGYEPVEEIQSERVPVHPS